MTHRYPHRVHLSCRTGSPHWFLDMCYHFDKFSFLTAYLPDRWNCMMTSYPMSSMLQLYGSVDNSAGL